MSKSGARRRQDFTIEAQVQQTKVLFGRSLAGVLANLVNSALVAVVMWGEVDSTPILGWTAAVWISTGLRYLLILKFHSSQITRNNFRMWQMRMIIMLLIMGVVWGSSALLLFPLNSPLHQVFLAFVLGGMIVGAVVVDSAVFEAFLVYTLFAGTPIAIRFMLQMDTLHFSMGIMCFVYMGALTAVARSVYHTTERSINIDFERNEEKLKVERLNEKLLLEVAERNLAEQKLRQERDIFVGGPVVLFLWRAEEGWPVEYVSPNVAQFGYTQEELSNGKMLFAQMVSVKDLKRVMDEVKTHARMKSDSFSQVYRIVSADGKERWVDDFTVTVRDANGNITNYQGYLTDTTDRKKMQDKLQESEERYRLLVELSPYAVVVHSGGKVVYANDMGVKLIGGHSLAEYVGVNVFDFIHPDSKSLAMERLRDVSQEGKSLPMAELKFVKKNGEVLDVEVISAPFIYQGMTTVMTMFSDITERKRAEDERKKLIGELGQAVDKAQKERNIAEEATRLKDQFVGMVSHDLRSPFGSIVSVLKMVVADKKNPLDEGRREIMGSVIESGERMMTMIDDLLNLTRLHTGQLSVRSSFFDMQILSKTAIENNRFMAEKKNIDIVDEIPPDQRVYGDSSLLAQVVNNLVSNAVKFCDKGDRITISIPEGSKAALSVKDTGGGVEPEFINDLFKHEVKTTGVGAAGEIGTGLGLPFSNDIMTANGGTLEVASNPDEGATFTMRFPSQQPRVLVVDDDVITRTILADMLRRSECESTLAENGQEGLEMFEREDFHLVVIDLLMPVFDGFSFLESARQSKRKGKTPIMVLTSDDKPETRNKAFRMGADDFIHKSLVKTDFIPRVNRLLSIWRGY
ncbi:MAG: PAS domain S-box protein [Nitrospinota bacterium]|nr:PAS domain S-box protein [Nitrospinota bacterium]